MFADNLKKYRKKCGLTQNEVANTLNLSRSTYSYYELGKTFPDLNTLSKLVKIFDTTYDELLDDNEITGSVTRLNDVPFVYGMDNSEDSDKLQREEKLMITFFRLLPTEEKKNLINDMSKKLRDIYCDSI